MFYFAQTFAATASAGLRACVPVRQRLHPHACADACKPSETRIGCEPLLPACAFILSFLFVVLKLILFAKYKTKSVIKIPCVNLSTMKAVNLKKIIIKI